MRIFNVACVLFCLPLLASETALADGVQLKISNDGTEDIVVTVYDLNTRPKSVVVQNARINGFSSLPISASVDASGMANLSWTATSVDPNSRKCGHDQTMGLGNDAAVHVHADSSCEA
jgi:hypothetical protein